MKVCTISGRLTKDSNVQTNEGREFVTFSVAVDDGYGQNKGVMFFDVTYNRTGVAPYLKKGKQVVVSGELKQREYNGKTYLSIRANDLALTGGGQGRPDPASDTPPPSDSLDDEIPF